MNRISRVNLFLAAKLPAAFLCGVRLRSLSDEVATASVTHRWINANPFGSMYFAVQMMAAELTTGALLMSGIRKSGRKISMVVSCNSATFKKKVTGRVIFKCERAAIDELLANLKVGEPAMISLSSIGVDELGDVVSEMQFTWRVKAVS